MSSSVKRDPNWRKNFEGGLPVTLSIDSEVRIIRVEGTPGADIIKVEVRGLHGALHHWCEGPRSAFPDGIHRGEVLTLTSYLNPKQLGYSTNIGKLRRES